VPADRKVARNPLLHISSTLASTQNKIQNTSAKAFAGFDLLCNSIEKPFRDFELIPRIGIFYVMAKNTSILLGEYFENFVNEKISTGKFASVSEVIRTALRLMEDEENRYKALINELEIGEKSGFVKDFNRSENLKNLHVKHLK